MMKTKHHERAARCILYLIHCARVDQVIYSSPPAEIIEVPILYLANTSHSVSLAMQGTASDQDACSTSLDG